MDKNIKDNKENNVHIEQVTPERQISNEERKAIIKFTDNEEQLSKTQQFRLLNSKKKKDDFELPRKKVGLGETIKIKISDLRAKIDEEMEMPTLKKKKSLYDTVIIKLDDLINNHKALKTNNLQKIINVEETQIEKKFHFFKPRDITKNKNIKINVESEEFGRQLYNINRLALINLSNQKDQTVRKASIASRIGRIEKIKISKNNYLKYQTKLNKFAINKLYYKFAPKETKKYKIYKYSVIVSSFLLFLTSFFIVNWFVQGIQINSLSNAIAEETPIVSIEDEGTIITTQEPIEDEIEGQINEKPENKESLYWKYLNTPLSSVDFTELIKQNSDTVAWIIMNNTNINYPIVQTKDNDYYLSHDFNKKKNQAGWVFADFRDNFSNFNNNMILYGHGRKDGVMFGSLNNALKAKWYKDPDNQIIQLSTIKYNTMWQIFSIYKIQAESYYITTDFASEESYQTFINTMKKRSIYDFGVKVTTNDKLLTLSTCYNNNGIRIVVQAKLVKIQER